MNELQELKRKVQEADLSVNNPRIQKIFEDEIASWIESYQMKKQTKKAGTIFEDGFGDIPDKIKIDGKEYCPEEILHHVKERNQVGMAVLIRMQQYRDERINLKKIVFDYVKDDTDLDGFVYKIKYGERKVSWRWILEGIINTDHNMPFLRFRLREAIKSFYLNV